MLGSCLWRGYVPAGETYWLRSIFAPVREQAGDCSWKQDDETGATTTSYTTNTSRTTQTCVITQTVDWRGATRTWCRDKPNVSTTWVHSSETSVRHSKSSAMWPGRMCRISLPMGRDRITCLPLRREPPEHKAHCWRVPTHCVPWRPATSTQSGSRRSGMVIKTVNETVRVCSKRTTTTLALFPDRS